MQTGHLQFQSELFKSSHGEFQTRPPRSETSQHQIRVLS